MTTVALETPVWRLKLRNINSWLLVAFGFILPFSVAVDGILAGLIAFLSLLAGADREGWRQLRSNRLVWAVLGFYLLHIIGMFWTEDLAAGFRLLQKESLLLFLPILMLAVRREHQRYYVLSFLSAMLVQVALSYAIWFGFIPPFDIAPQTDPVPFMGHISYNPFLAIAIYLLLYFLIFDKSIGKGLRGLGWALVMACSINMFITQGRAGQVAYFVMLVVVVFQYYNRYAFKAALISAVAVSVLFGLMYKTNGSFQERVDGVVWDLQHYETKKGSPVGARITFALNSFDIVKRHPLVGVGTGDFNVEYARVDARTTQLGGTTNPHNMYTLEAVQFGLLGILSLVSILFAQWHTASRSGDPFQRRFGVALPIIFAVIMLSDTYLRGFFTTMLFVYLSTFTYREWDAS
jgi:O-antigen ligase